MGYLQKGKASPFLKIVLFHRLLSFVGKMTRSSGLISTLMKVNFLGGFTIKRQVTAKMAWEIHGRGKCGKRTDQYICCTWYRC